MTQKLQTQHIPHRTPQDSKKTHREHQSPHRKPEKTNKTTSRNPPQHGRQRPAAKRDPRSETYGELHHSYHRVYRTSRTPHGNNPPHRLHTGASENAHREENKPKHTTHRRQHEGKGTTGEYPRLGGHGTCRKNGAQFPPLTTLAPPQNTEHTPMHHAEGRPQAPKFQQHTCTPRARNRDTHKEQHLPPSQYQHTKRPGETGSAPHHTHTASQIGAHTTYPPSRRMTSPTHSIIPHISRTPYRQRNLAHFDPTYQKHREP